MSFFSVIVKAGGLWQITCNLLVSLNNWRQWLIVQRTRMLFVCICVVLFIAVTFKPCCI